MNYKSNSFYIVVLSALSITLSLFSAPYAYSAENELKIGGVGSALGTMKVLGLAFEKAHPGIRVKIFPSLGSTGGIKAAAEGSIDIGLSGRGLQGTEVSLELSITEYSKTPLVLVANKSVRASGLTTREIVEIYKGEKLAWPDGQRIRLILRPSHDSDTLVIRKITPEMGRAVEAALSREGMLAAATDQENADIIEKTPGAVGFSTLSQIVSEERRLQILTYNGMSPGVNNFASGHYPIFKSLFIVTKHQRSDKVNKFLDFIKSPEGRKILEEYGSLFVADKPENK
ncbi:MAG: substrate-binding domain-containing protein [Nitrospirae bacterium]|nr:substrate-binding domain-containing protein [Nitrospirota bacterium]